jgi:oligopeptide/dipeptide ABC transporter ATP-binding protein
MVRHLSDEIVVMFLGRVVEDGPYHAVLDNALHPYTRALTASVPVPDPDARTDAELRRAAKSEVVLEEPPDAGCPYQPRCPLAIAVCSAVLPPLIALRPNHQAACHVAAAESGVATVPVGDSLR